MLQLTGTITALSYETLTVNDGQNYNDKQLLNVGSSSDGVKTDIGTVSSTGRYMWIRFQTSSYNNAYDGLDLIVTLIAPNTVGGIVTSGQYMTLQFNVTGYNLGPWEELNLNVTRVDVCLDNIGNNSESISQNAGRQGLNVALKNRTLYKDGKWNTLCLPFDVTLSGSPLEGATARSLTTAKIEGSTLDLTFGDAVTELVAGTPYIIKWANGSDIVSPVLFEGVTVSTDKHDYDTDGDNTTTDERVRFVGTYESSVFSAEDNSILLVGGSNTLFYPNERTGLGAQRAYFKIGADGALQARRLTSFNFNEGQNGTTGILTVGTKMEKAGEPDTWYTLDGMKLQGKPTKKGLYTINGKKFVIK